MTTYYVDSVNGSDSNNGLGPDASAGTNKPWKTIAKALGASGIASGDTVYLSPAGPFRETVTVAMTSASLTTNVTGDPGNAQGFKTSGGAAVAPGPIIHTAFTTNDKTAPSASVLLNLAGRAHLSFSRIMFVGGSAANMIQANGTTENNTSFTDCAFIGPNILINAISTFATAMNWTIDRCLFLCQANNAIKIMLALGTGSDYNVNFVITNSFCTGGASFIQTGSSASGANKGGGVVARNCTYVGANNFWAASGSSSSLTIPCNVFDSLMVAGGNATFALLGGTSGQIVEDYNIIISANPRSNVATGTHSKSDGSYAPLFSFGQERIWGMLLRPFCEPMAGSPILGFNADGSQTSYDGYNRPRPAGGASANPAAGWLDRGNTAAQASSPSPPSGTHIWQATGPWYQDFQLPVSAASTTVGVRDQFDASYTGTKPSLLIPDTPGNRSLGVAPQTITDAGSSGAWNTLTSASFTPTAAGFITVRLASFDTSGVSVVEFADWSIT